MNDDRSSNLLVTVIIVPLLLVATGWWIHENWGRERVAQCFGGPALFSPGSFKEDWVIKEKEVTSNGDGGVASVWRVIRRYDDENEARRACKEGEY